MRRQQSGNLGPTGALLGMLGHSEACIALAKTGRTVSCDCRTSDMDDPAVAVGLAMHYARIATNRSLPIPAVVIELLALRVREGDPACRSVSEWLDQRGLLDIKYTSDQGSHQ
jgi:hypothetical protein